MTTSTAAALLQRAAAQAGLEPNDAEMEMSLASLKLEVEALEKLVTFCEKAPNAATRGESQ